MMNEPNSNPPKSTLDMKMVVKIVLEFLIRQILNKESLLHRFLTRHFKTLFGKKEDPPKGQDKETH